jgi:hypothetical protein
MNQESLDSESVPAESLISGVYFRPALLIESVLRARSAMA